MLGNNELTVKIFVKDRPVLRTRQFACFNFAKTHDCVLTLIRFPSFRKYLYLEIFFPLHRSKS